ncbi:hypothetical protein GQ607_016107 [Colletotrichum asianum]|uniref:Uncharacterized protein n=1 Tax=Colletotrichum asianum TaxID=702518 RepID=A0A8H3VYE7_9PEZI|nr:hypothetical protein GQ607_016107 [Colletotrichum asianum]
MTRPRPIQKFASAVSQCSVETTLYGKCIVADYNSVHKDKCVKEFLRLKDCYIVHRYQPTASYGGSNHITNTCRVAGCGSYS